MTRRTRILEPASEELAAAVGWYETRRAGLGRQFFDTIQATIGLIEQRPEIGAANVDTPNTRRAIIRRFPFQLVYQIRSDEIIVVAIAHLKRRPGYWRHRS